jgi:hypothetical protein
LEQFSFVDSNKVREQQLSQTKKIVNEKLVEIKLLKSVSRNVILKIILSANGLSVPDSRIEFELAPNASI